MSNNRAVPPPAGPTAPPSSEALLEALAGVVRGYYDDLTAVAARHGLSTSQARALIALHEPMTMSALAEHLVCDASNATGLITRMQARGLVVRTPSPADRRSRMAARTPEGTDLAHRVRVEMGTVRDALDSLTEAERTALHPLLVKLDRLLTA